MNKETDDLIQEFVAAGGDWRDWRPSWNIAPTQTIPVVVESTKSGELVRRLEPARWSLVPSWSKELTLKYPTFNAQSESITEKASYKGPIRNKRCLIPATGYYEWTTSGSTKTPHFVHGDSDLSFAGLYSWWRAGPDSDWVLTATIITMAAEPVPHMAQLHDRIPVTLSRDWWADWLNPELDGDQNLMDAAVQSALTVAQQLEYHRVAPVRGDGPELIEPVSD